MKKWYHMIKNKKRFFSLLTGALLLIPFALISFLDQIQTGSSALYSVYSKLIVCLLLGLFLFAAIRVAIKNIPPTGSDSDAGAMSGDGDDCNDGSGDKK